MNYHALAEKLIDLHAFLRLVPVARKLSVIDKGTFFALNYLMSPQRAVHPKELSQKMAVSSARIAALLNHMEQEGLVVREPDPDDNRQINVSLTDQGKRLIKNIRAEVVDIMAEALEGLGPEDAETYHRIQMKMVQNLMRQT